MSNHPDPECDNDFDWSSNDKDIIVHPQDAIAVYPNKYGAVVLRRERAWDEEDDACIIIGKAHALKVAYAILEAAGMGDVQFYRGCTGGGGFEGVLPEDVVADLAADHETGGGPSHPHDASGPKDPTACERQRRHPSRKRNGREGATRHDVTRDTSVMDLNSEASAVGELFPQDVAA